MFIVVQKKFGGPDGDLELGELIDATEWRNLDRLLDQNFVRAATELEVKSACEEKPVKKIKRRGKVNS